ncbi:MAG TPA: glycosyltransferase family 9 protein [Aggregatilineales bacterium]|nr:glycosyltransferase family 9 protein [Aggregatilineales bacterium]
MDKESIVLRNRAMTEAFHAIPIKHRVRHWLLRGARIIPVLRQKSPDKERILLIRPDHVGDMLLTIPAIRALKQAKPHAEIHALVGGWSAGVLANITEIDTVLTLDFPGFTRNGNGGAVSPYQLALKTARQLRKVGYTSAVILRPDHWWGALVTYLAGIPERIGYATRDVRPFLTHPIIHTHRHAILQNLRLIERWTGEIPHAKVQYSYPLEDEDTQFIDGYLAECGFTPQTRLLCIHAGAGTWVKRWDETHWAHVADTLSEQLDCTVVFTGGGHELGMIRAITNNMKTNPCVMAGNTEIGQLAALYARALAVIGPDSGPLHLAAAMNTPTVALFGPADPLEFAPWGSREQHYIITSDIGCRPCRVLDWGNDSPDFHPCVREISVGRVLDATRRAVQASNRG